MPSRSLPLTCTCSVLRSVQPWVISNQPKAVAVDPNTVSRQSWIIRSRRRSWRKRRRLSTPGGKGPVLTSLVVRLTGRSGQLS